MGQNNYKIENNEQDGNGKSYLSIISLNVNGLNSPIKRYRGTVYIKNKLRDYLDYPNEQTFVISKLAQELHNYKNLRGLVLSIQNYEMTENVEILNFSVPEHDVILPERKIDIRRFVPSEDEEEPLFAPNSEEEENYLRYIDSLPIESFYDDDSDSYTDQIEKKRR